MTPQEAREAAAVMLAFADGSKIQWRDRLDPHMVWRDTGDPTWRWKEIDFRIAPEPWTGKIWVHPGSGAVRDESHFDLVTPTTAGWRLITAKEVGDE